MVVLAAAVALAGWPGLTVHVDALPSELDPRMAASDHAVRLLDLQYDRLFRHSAREGTFHPVLFDEVSLSRDDRRITVRLASARWHDGREVLPDDVCFTLTTVPTLPLGRDAPLYRSLSDVVEACDVTEDGARITLRTWPSVDPRILLDVPLLPAHATPSGRPGATGSGPFRGEVDDYEAFFKAVDVPHHDPYLKRLAFVIREPETAARDFTAGSADLLLPLHPAFLAEIGQSHDIELDDGAGHAWAMLALDPSDPRLGSASVRRALAQAVDRTDLVGTLWYGTTQTFDPSVYLHGSLVPDVPADGLALPQSADLSEVQRLMAEAGAQPSSEGWQIAGEPLSLRMAVQDAPRMRRIAATLADQLEAAGYTIEPVTVPATGFAWLADAPAGHFDLVLGTWQLTTDSRLADTFLHPRERDANPFDVTGEKLTSHLAALSTASTPDERRRVAGEIARQVWDDSHYIPLWNETPTAAWFRGRLVNARFEPRYAFMWIRDWRQ